MLAIEVHKFIDSHDENVIELFYVMVIDIVVMIIDFLLQQQISKLFVQNHPHLHDIILSYVL